MCSSDLGSCGCENLAFISSYHSLAFLENRFNFPLSFDLSAVRVLQISIIEVLMRGRPLFPYGEFTPAEAV